MKATLMFIFWLAAASTVGGTCVYLLDCAFGDSLRAWFSANPDSAFMLLAIIIGFSFGSFRAGQEKGGKSEH